jgi:hypothetical protein
VAQGVGPEFKPQYCKKKWSLLCYIQSTAQLFCLSICFIYFLYFFVCVFSELTHSFALFLWVRFEWEEIQTIYSFYIISFNFLSSYLLVFFLKIYFLLGAGGSHPGSKDQEDCGSKLVRGKLGYETLSWNKPFKKKKRAGGVAQGIHPEFKP